MNHVHHSRCPVVEEQTITMVAEIGGAEARKAFDVLWLRESETILRLVHRGAVINDIQTTTDFYGFLTSQEGAIADASLRAAEMRIDGRTELQVVAFLRVFDEPRLASRAEAFGGRVAYESIPDDWRLDEWNEEYGNRWRPRLANRSVLGGDEGVEIWSTTECRQRTKDWVEVIEAWKADPRSAGWREGETR